MANPVLALANLKNEVSNRFEETCACGGVVANDAIVGILQTLAKVCGDQRTKQVLERAASHVKPVEEQADVLGFDAQGNPVQDNPDLNPYASTIRGVFDKIAVLYQDGISSGDWDDAACDILGVLDADVCGEIISVARSVEEKQ